MEYINYLKEKREFHDALIEFIEKQSHTEVDIQNIKRLINEQKIQENKQKLKECLVLILKISNHYHRTADFYEYIEKILLILKEFIQNHF